MTKPNTAQKDRPRRKPAPRREDRLEVGFKPVALPAVRAAVQAKGAKPPKRRDDCDLPVFLRFEPAFS